MSEPSAVSAAILSRHSKDLVVPECKDGPTQGTTGHRRLDFWVLRRSWAHPSMIGYEVKASRSDFLGDQKWMTYLELCNELYFIETWRGLIAPNELPAEVGLLRLAGSRLITVKRAAWREIPVPDGLLTYVLMCRTRIQREGGPDENRARAYWRSWLAERKWDWRLGHEVSRRLRRLYEAEVQDVRERNRHLEEENAKLEELRLALDARGIQWKGWHSAETVLEEISAPKWIRHKIETARDALAELLKDEPREAAS